MTPTTPVVRTHDTLPMQVANMTFLVNKLGEDCAPLQYVRELTQNGLEAIAQLGRGSNQIIWDVDWTSYDLLDGVYKLSCIDTGAGMTGEDMVTHINKLSSSIREQSATGNFGVGAKISAAPRNPHGLVYMSWKNGVGHMIHLWYDPEEKVYGLKRWPKNNGEFWTVVSDDLKPKEIEDHGTVVVLLGKSDEDNTMEPPTGTPMRSRWILRYLNTRYFRFPEGVVVKAREGWELPRADSRHNFLRVVEGQGAWLDKNCESSGEVKLAGAKAHWWIIKSEIDKDSGHVAPGGHIAALYQNELYELQVGRAGIAKLQAFGAIFGADRVVIYVEPDTNHQPVVANTARTQLLIEGEPLDWAGWAAGFREQMPEDLTRLQEEIGAQAGEKDHKKAILERLKQIKDLLRFSRFRPAKDGTVAIDPESSIQGGEPLVRGGRGEGTRDTREPGKKGGRAGDLYALFAESGALNYEPVESFGEPETRWVSIEDGTRIPPDLDDRAAKFLLQQNMLLINADFRAFTDMVDRWALAYANVPGARATVKEVVHEWFEQTLIETVMSAQALKRTGTWSLQELSQLWTEDALTAAVLPRWHIDQSIKRNLGHRLGSLKAA
jgi:hypothetical protein